MSNSDKHPYSAEEVRVLPQVTTIRELLSLLRDYPGLMGSRQSVSNLASFLIGFNYCRRSFGVTEDGEFLSSLDQWIHKKYKLTSTVGWSKIIEFNSYDDSSSLQLFWELFDKFIQECQGRQGGN